MTNSEDLNSPDTLASLSSAKVHELNGGGSSSGSSSSNNYQSSAPIYTQSGNSSGARKKSEDSVPVETDGSDRTPASSTILPFNLIHGEIPIQVAQTTDGPLVISNYRLFIQGREAQSNFPLGIVDAVEVRDIFYLHVQCKDARQFRVTFPNNESVMDVMKRIQQGLASPKKIEDFFAFTFQEKVEIELADDMRTQMGLQRDLTTHSQRFYKEVARMEFNVQNPWRVSDENEDFELCSSYPKLIIVPNSIDKKKLEQVAGFRSSRRFPAVVWRHRGNGAVICRCSQPEVGWFGWRSTEDEELVQNIIQACAYQANERNHAESQTVPLDSFSVPSSSNHSLNGMSIELVPETNVKKLLILDARSYTTAVANRARGGGCECLEYYPNCEIQFMNLANIHSIRKSFANVRELCALPSDRPNWYSQLENCKWLQHMSGLMKAAVTVVTAIEHDGRPVMVHCSDGWDRTPQIVALAEILLDPYYRSLEGFQVLVEREWLDYGHKFGDRCGQGMGSEDGNERCPVFLQWLDCLHQLVKQFPSAFEFNMAFLVKLVQHTYSNLFGTFLCNTAKEREQHNIPEKTMSVWKFLSSAPNKDKFRNSLYINCDRVLWPACEVRDLALWSQVYLGYENPPPLLTEAVNPSQESSPAPSIAESENSGRRDSAPRMLSTKARSSSLESLNAGVHTSKGLQRKMSDSSLYSPDHESENGVPSKDDYRRATEVDEHLMNTTTYTKPTYAQVSQSGTVVFAPLEDSDNEDTEPNSANSESTVINAHRFNLKSIESSTDTLVAEMGVSSSSGDLKLQLNGNSQKTDTTAQTKVSIPVTPSSNASDAFTHDDGSGGDHALIEEIERATMDLNLDGSENRPMSMSDAEKLLNVDGLGLTELGYGRIGNSEHCHLPLGMIGHCPVCESSQNILDSSVQEFAAPLGMTGYANGGTHPSSISSGIGLSRYGSKYSSYITPAHSRTPSNSVSASQLNDDSSYNNGYIGPGSSLLVRERPSLESSVGMRQSLGVDGLTHFHDEVQNRLSTIVNGYKNTIVSLHEELHKVRMALSNQVSHKCTHFPLDRPDDTVSVAGSITSSEQHSVVSQSSEASSFEAVDELDTQPPRWVPDYAVTHCMGCNVCFGAFWSNRFLGKRKHHCRACGRVFCAECSENTIQLFHITGSVGQNRVCRSCYTYHNRIRNGISEASGSVSNGNQMNGGDSSSPVTNGASNSTGHSDNGATASSPMPVPNSSQVHGASLTGSNSTNFHAKGNSSVATKAQAPPTSKFPETHHSTTSTGHSSNGRHQGSQPQSKPNEK